MNLFGEDITLPVTPSPAPPRVSLDQPGDPLEYISASRLKSFLTCRLRFYFEKVVGLRKPAGIKLQLGRSVHEALKVYHKARWMDEAIGQNDMLKSFRSHFLAEENRTQVEPLPEDEWLRQVAEGEKLLIAYLASGLGLVEDKPIGVEIPVMEEIAGLPAPLYGIVDLIRSGPVAVDFKTTGTTPQPEMESWLHEIQLVTYAMLIESATGEPIQGAELIYLVRTKAPKVIRVEVPAPNIVQKNRFRSLVDSYYRGVKNGDYHPCPGQHCSWCPFREECAQWQGRGVRS